MLAIAMRCGWRVPIDHARPRRFETAIELFGLNAGALRDTGVALRLVLDERGELLR